MKATLLGSIGGAAVIAVVWLLVGAGLTAKAERVPADDLQGELVTISTPIAEGRQQLIVIDPRTRVMSVYHVETSKGTVTLKSVRNILWDLRMDEFNGVSPLPREIRGLLQNNR